MAATPDIPDRAVVSRRRLPELTMPGVGWRIVARKELADHLLGIRFVVLLIILGFAAATSVYAASSAIRAVASDASGTASLFLRSFAVAPEQVPPFYALVGFLVPLLGIAFGFDSVNGERAQGTLPRLLAQPIYRDDVINGKFAAGLAVIGLIMTVMTTMVAALTIIRLGIVPSAGEVIRIVVWIVVSVVYVGFWLAFATLCSVALRRAATSALVAIGVWIAIAIFANLVVSLVAGVIAPAPADASTSALLSNAQLQELLARLSPTTLYQEATVVLLNPGIRTIGVILPQQADRAIPSTLSLDQSLLLVWPQVVALVGLTVASFALAYVLFMRQEVRA